LIAGEFMKTLLVLTALLVSNFAMASGMRSYDCDKGDDGMGGKFCHYEIAGKCSQPTCEEAVECVVKLVHRSREGKAVSVHIASSEVSQVVRDGEPQMRFPVQSQYENCNGRQCLTPMIVYTKASVVQPGLCQPTALKLIGAE
jgi:hypothetical protein